MEIVNSVMGSFFRSGKKCVECSSCFLPGIFTHTIKILFWSSTQISEKTKLAFSKYWAKIFLIPTYFLWCFLNRRNSALLRVDHVSGPKKLQSSKTQALVIPCLLLHIGVVPSNRLHFHAYDRLDINSFFKLIFSSIL